ncbi:hypothetical protein IGJ02_002621 [Enterococcus sp. DIV0724b]|uniref:WxL domain-containing protein n=1 Tax=Enterococcus sp. DIV0724b TaxID=2774694 RepID=UPI003D2FEB1E
MMKKLVISSLLVSTVALGGFGMSVSAAPTTNGKASFTDKDAHTHVVKPQTLEAIKDVTGGQAPDGSVAESGAVRLMYAPTFDFGINQISTIDADYAVKMNSVQPITWTENIETKPSTWTHKNTQTGDPAKDAAAYDIPQFVQVSDISGIDTTNWNVTVKQDTAFTNGTGADAKTLKAGTTIDIYGQTLTTTSETAVANLAAGMTMDASGKASIPIGKDVGGLKVLGRKDSTAASATTGTITSNVFKKEYGEADYSSTKTATSTEDFRYNNDVKLHVPAQKITKDVTYSTTLTWAVTIGE